MISSAAESAVTIAGGLLASGSCCRSYWRPCSAWRSASSAWSRATAYGVAQTWSILAFAFVAFQAQTSLRRAYRELAEHSPVHRVLHRLWIMIYAFVGIQLAWALRPFVGHPDLPAQLFRDEIGNAYVEVFRIVLVRLGL